MDFTGGNLDDQSWDRREKHFKCFRARYLITFLCFCTMIFVYCQRVSLNVAIIAMVNETAVAEITERGHHNETSECHQNSTQHQRLRKKYRSSIYVWDPLAQGWILSAMYYGYTIMNLFAGWVSHSIGPKTTNILGLFLGSLLTLLIPVTASLGLTALFIVRFLQGAAQGLNFPAIFTLFARWVPDVERATMWSISTIGIHIGSAIGMPITAYLIVYGFAGGWPSAFYVFGAAGIILCILFYFLVTTHPVSHPLMANRELQYISRTTLNISTVQKARIPWMNILTSKPVFATLFAKLCWFYGFTTLQTKLPAYLDRSLGLPIEENGFINAIMYTALSASMLVSGLLSDFLLKRHVFSITTIRKIFEMGGLLGPGFCILGIPFAGCDTWLVTLLLVAAMAFFGMIGGGDIPICGDMSPEFAGVIFGITNGVAGVSAFTAPMVAGYFLQKGSTSLFQWSEVFYVTSGIYFVGAVVFLCGASGELQSWGSSSPPSSARPPPAENRCSPNPQPDNSNSSAEKSVPTQTGRSSVPTVVPSTSNDFENR